ncbi:BppU family phage baseplate upper protein [Bacillus sp. JJ1474]|uniref:BppU family phage baseplate upper protein n=1 Tax=Bacillus sp. JJ1474 TaxID=3122955 RepID=UPI002FFD677A
MRRYNIVSDLVLVKPIEPIVYKQFDNGDNLEVELYQDNEKVNLENETVLAFFQLEDENKTVIQKTCSIKNGNAIATLDNNILSVSGNVKVEFTIYDGEKETTTRTILITVESSINRNEAIETVPQWDIVSQIIVDGQDIINGAELATIRANEAADTANQTVSVLHEVTQAAQTATSSANLATTNANNSATEANTQAQYAKTQGDYAKDKGDYAATRGDIALSNATEAFIATSDAKATTTKMNTLINNTKSFGEYDPLVTYYSNNFVLYQGSSYICKKESMGNLPTNEVYFQLVAQRGIDGSGAVSKVNGKSPDLDGNVQITNIASADDASKLGGNLPSHYATAQSVTDVDDKIGVLQGNINSHFNDYMPHDSDLSSYASNPDVNGVYTVVDFKRPDNTLHLKSTLSNPDGDGNYQTVTWQFYEANGMTPALLATWTINYDAEGNIINKVVI